MRRLNNLKVCSTLLLLITGSASGEDFFGLERGFAYWLAPQTEMRNRGVVIQQADWSCASASMATMLAEKFEVMVPENILFDLIVNPMAEHTEMLKRLEENGMTAGHLQQMAKTMGFQGQGVRRSLSGLLEAEPLPVIAHITEPHPDEPGRMYQHWVVISGVAGERVMVRDPVRGNRRMPIYAFRAAWLDKNGKGFLFRVERDVTEIASTVPTAQNEISNQHLQRN